MTPKQIVELSIDATLLANARERGIDLAGILENGLRRLDCEPADVREARSRQWSEENREAIEASNRELEQNGMWYEKLR